MITVGRNDGDGSNLSDDVVVMGWGVMVMTVGRNDGDDDGCYGDGERTSEC